MKKSGIYKIINNTNGKIYIGSSRGICQRWRQHLHLLRSNRHFNPHLQNAWNLNPENFSFDIVEDLSDISDNFLINREQYWILFFNTYNNTVGYNIRPPVGLKINCKINFKCPTCKNIFEGYPSQKRKYCSIICRVKDKIGIEMSKEQRQKIGLSNSISMVGNKNGLGTKRSLEVKKKMLLTWTGRKHTDESKHKMSEARKRYLERIKL